MYAGGLMSPMQRCFSDVVCQPLVTSYVINAYLCFAVLHAWTLEYQHMMDAVCLRRQKANGQLEKTAGSPSQCLAQQGSGGCQHYTALRSGELRPPGVMEGHSCSLGLCDDDDDDDKTCVKKCGVKLIFRGTYRLSGIGILNA